jgi:hypothetical protein
MAEKFTFNETIRNRRTVHRNKSRRRAGTVVVNGPGDKLLSRPAFTRNQNVGRHGCRLGD